ncbi:MAG: RsmD family RNA methyltransferase, partial [Acidimicrobiia bacterium]
RVALEALRSNIDAVGLGGTIVSSSVADFLAVGSATFDIVFIDPPWSMSSEALSDDLTALDRFLEPKAEVVLSRRWGDETPTQPENWRVATDRRYGDTRILRYEKETDAS